MDIPPMAATSNYFIAEAVFGIFCGDTRHRFMRSRLTKYRKLLSRMSRDVPPKDMRHIRQMLIFFKEFERRALIDHEAKCPL